MSQHGEKVRELFDEVALIVAGQYHHAMVILLMDDGSLKECHVERVRVEGPTRERL